MACQIQVIRRPDVVLVEVIGDSFLLQSIQEMCGTAQSLIDEGSSKPVAICTDGLSLLGSSCLSGIIDVAFQLRKHGIPVFVAEARQDALEVFDIASLKAILPVFDTPEDGLDALRRMSS
jgi:anti-anti-sigma regulatory factor